MIPEVEWLDCIIILFLLFGFWGNCHTVFHSSYTALHFASRMQGFHFLTILTTLTVFCFFFFFLIVATWLWAGSSLWFWFLVPCDYWCCHSVMFNWDPVDCCTPGLSVLHHLLELAQTHVRWVGDAIQPSQPLSSPFPHVFSLFQHQGLFQWVGSSHQMATVLELQLQHQSF